MKTIKLIIKDFVDKTDIHDVIISLMILSIFPWLG